jgi:hypothetical protein
MLSNRLAFSLIMCAIVFPMLALDKIPDPLSGTAWSRATTSASAIVPFALASIYAGGMSFRLRRKKSATLGEYFVAGSTIGLVPAVFYTLVTPFATASPPLVAMFLLGAVFGPLFGGSGFALLRNDNKGRHDT